MAYIFVTILALFMPLQCMHPQQPHQIDVSYPSEDDLCNALIKQIYAEEEDRDPLVVRALRDQVRQLKQTDEQDFQECAIYVNAADKRGRPKHNNQRAIEERIQNLITQALKDAQKEAIKHSKRYKAKFKIAAFTAVCSLLGVVFSVVYEAKKC